MNSLMIFMLRQQSIYGKVCRSVCWSVGRAVGRSVLTQLSKKLYVPCQSIFLLAGLCFLTVF